MDEKTEQAKDKKESIEEVHQTLEGISLKELFSMIKQLTTTADKLKGLKKDLSKQKDELKAKLKEQQEKEEVNKDVVHHL